MMSRFDPIKLRLEAWDELFRARPYRERVMLAGMAAAVVFFTIDTFAIQPINGDRARISLGTERVRDNLEIKRAEANALMHAEASPDEKRTAAEIEQLGRQLKEIKAQMGTEMAALIPPRAIVAVLEDLLAEDPNLQLISVRSQAPKRIGSGDAIAGRDSNLGLYRHGLRLEIEGDFPATLHYLRRIEASRWNLLWDRLDYRVQQYPTATVTIDIHTLSEQEEWIGV